MPGPKPKPTSLKLLQGNPGKRALPTNEPTPRPISPDKPDFGENEPASAYWDQLSPVLDAMGCHTEADGHALWLLCLELSTVALCEQHLWGVESIVYKTTNGSEAPTAWLKQRREASKAAESLMARLGLTPADRSKIEGKKPDEHEEDPTAKAIGIAAIRK